MTTETEKKIIKIRKTMNIIKNLNVIDLGDNDLIKSLNELEASLIDLRKVIKYRHNKEFA